MRFEVLGPVRVHAGDSEISINAPRLRTLLALLLLQPNRAVSVDALCDAIWPVKAPQDVRNQLQQYVLRLRRLLAETGADAGVVVTEPGGYRIVVDPQCLDLHEFRRLVGQARTAAGQHQPDSASSDYRTALALWRGPALADVDCASVRRAADALDAERVEAFEQCLGLELWAGKASELLTELDQLIGQHPYREKLRGLQMLALYRAGRYPEALAAYRRVHRLMRDELGVEPGQELQELHRAILDRDPGLEVTRPARVTATFPVPRQLPGDVAGFVGRAAELEALDQLLGQVGQGRPGTVVISAIAGTAGVGKTALAVHAAHRLVDRYPDGQLFIDLHGYTHGVAPVEPAEALDYLLRALGVPGPQLPETVDQRAALFRSRLADQRMLVVLDNAATEAQVAPLLPGGSGCLVLVTSRRRLAGLDPTHALSLDTLPSPDAVMLLRQGAGGNRLAGQPPELVVELVELCGRLPLAIRIAAARLRSHPSWDLSYLVGRLRDQRHRLVELAAGQRSIIAALDLSCQQLSAEQQRIYRLLGLHPGPDIDGYATAALLDTTLPEAGGMLEQLYDAHLLNEPTPGQYRFHDLTRAHAAHTAARDETDSSRGAALGRLLDYYRYTASVAMNAAYPHEPERRPQVPPARTPTPVLSDPALALTWLDTERANLLSAARYATEHGSPAHVLHLSTMLHRHLRTRGHYHDAVTLHHQALTTARTTGHQAAELETLVGLGHIRRFQGRYELATDHLERALQLARATGNRTGELDALTGLGHVHGQQGRYEQATDHYQRALQLARATGYRTGELDALTGLGYIRRLQDRYEQATDHYRRALQLARATGNRSSELNALNGLGNVHRQQGRYEQATDHLGQALQLARVTGNRTGELDALTCLGVVHQRQGRYGQATDHYQQLLDLAHDSGDRNYEFEARQGMGRLQHATGHAGTAIAHHDQALALASELGQPADQARAHDGLARAHHALHQVEQARRHWQHALDILTDLGLDHTDDAETTAVAIRAHLASLGQQQDPPRS